MTKKSTFSAEFKARVALEAMRGDKSQAVLCREYNLSADLVSRWRQQLIERASELFATPAGRSAEQSRIAELERLVGQLSLELAAAKKTLCTLALPLRQKRPLIQELGGEYQVRLLCELLTCEPSSYYYQPQGRDDTQLREEIERIAVEFPRYGYRRITAELNRRGQSVNRKRILRIMRQESLLVQVKRYVHTTFSGHGLRRYPNLVKGLTAEGPDDIWCGDITYIRLSSEFLYLAVLMDLFTRGIRGWYLSRDLTEGLVHTALTRALANHSAPRIHHPDQGVQYAAQGYVALLEGHGTQISMAAVGRPTENAYAERLIRTLKEEEVYLHDYTTYEDACQHIGHFLEEVYMVKRVHSALGYLTPVEFEALHTIQTLPS